MIYTRNLKINCSTKKDDAKRDDMLKSVWAYQRLMKKYESLGVVYQDDAEVDLILKYGVGR